MEAGIEGLSKPNTKAGRLQRECLSLIREHEADGAIPTSIRFLFYELEAREIIPKNYPGARRTPAQDVSDAVRRLRECGLVPWEWIVDETRALHGWRSARSVYEYVEDTLPLARIDPWEPLPAPLILCESRSLAGVLREIASDYLCPIAATNGQAAGFLRTDLGPLVARVAGEEVRVLYFGDLDLSGGHIEENTRRVLQAYADLDWRRLAITEEQAHSHDLTAIEKADNRFRPARTFPAIETEALRQTEIQKILRDALDAELPEPLAAVKEREERQRASVRDRLSVSCDD